jgi:Tol biopolymer transport system component
MTGHDDFDRTLAGWFEADALPAGPAGGLDRVLEATRHRRPRPAWLSGAGSHWVGEALDAASSTGARSLRLLGLRGSTLLILLLAIAALVGGAILVGARLLQPPLLPTGRLGHLAYALDGVIYVADLDGSNPVRIADGLPGGSGACTGEADGGPMWSPDGQHLAYGSSSGERCTRIIVIVDPATKSIAAFPGSGWQIPWSPDSTRVATWVDMFNTIGIYGVDGVRQALLTVPPGCARAGDYDPVWSSDGRSLIGRACEVPIDGRPPQTLPSTDPRSHTPFAYSPDRARVAYTIIPGSLVIGAVDGSQDQVLIPSGVSYGGIVPVWSPTGDRIAFAGAPPSGADGIRPDAISVVDVASGAVTLLARAGGTGMVHVIGFSPDGERILFSTSDANDVGTSLRSVRADGSDPQVLVTGTADGEWQPLPAGQ